MEWNNLCYWNLHFWSNVSCDTIAHNQATDPLFRSCDMQYTKDATILDKEEHYKRRGNDKESDLGKSEITITQQEGRLRYNLSHAWVSTIKQIPRRLLSHD